MNIQKTLTIFLMTLTGFQIAAMQQPDLRQQLIDAGLESNVERVEQLMLAGVPVAPEALFCPTLNGNYDVVKTIFECGVDPESPTDPNQMFAGIPFFTHLVLNQNLQPQVKEKLIKLYVKHGADLEVRGPMGLSMLICGVHDLDFNTLKLLLEQGACANAQDNTGFTALMILVSPSAHSSSVKTESEKVGELKKKAGLLIEHGADVNLKDIYGESTLDRAKDQPEIMKFLKDAQKTTGEKSQDSQSDPTKKIINNREI